MMSPPSYNDLGKNARDIFSKGYHFGLLKLDCKTKTKSGVEFSSGGSSNQDTGKVFGSLETKYRISDYGMLMIVTLSVPNTGVIYANAVLCTFSSHDIVQMPFSMLKCFVTLIS
jgi:voltage-dependent anion channel protein 2